MGVRCRADEIAIYIPPHASSPLPPDAALERCQTFLADLLGPTADVKIFDDRAAALRITPGGLFDWAEGETPAFEAMAAAVANGVIRLLVVAEEGPLHRLPDPMGVRRLETDIQIVEAALVLSRRRARAPWPRFTTGNQPHGNPISRRLSNGGWKRRRDDPRRW
ncbi:hypothetical protein BH11MYX2_BH11MYX2_19480 [soil metagenome]